MLMLFAIFFYPFVWGCSLLSVTIIHQERAKVNSFLKVFSICTQCTITGFQTLENLFILPIDKLLRMWYNGNLRPGGPWPRVRILVNCRKKRGFFNPRFQLFHNTLDRCRPMFLWSGNRSRTHRCGPQLSPTRLLCILSLLLLAVRSFRS